MSDIVDRAEAFAMSAHQRIDHRRKYSNQPYHVHLEAVARIVASVTDDQEMIAAAWLHDVVEDTPATLQDVKTEFGASVASMVGELSDVSCPSDGNRLTRKAIDRRHTALASPRAKTIKLADLIDNCKDITSNDPRFAKVFLQEMEELLAVLEEGDATLLERAQALRWASHEKLLDQPATSPIPIPVNLSTVLPELANPRITSKFREAFTAFDIVEPLISFDADKQTTDIAEIMKSQHCGIAGIRIDGIVRGYVNLSDIQAAESTLAGLRMQRISTNQVLDPDAPLMDVVGILTRHDQCFIALFDSVVGVIERADMNKPVVRMWLFGAITLYEMELVKRIKRCFSGKQWQDLLSASRLEKARELQKERERRGSRCELIDCLQFSDKAQILLEHAETLEAMGLPSKRVGKQLIKELESLRNHLAHAQDLVTNDWVQIIRITQRIAELGSDRPNHW